MRANLRFVCVFEKETVQKDKSNTWYMYYDFNPDLALDFPCTFSFSLPQFVIIFVTRMLKKINQLNNLDCAVGMSGVK